MDEIHALGMTLKEWTDLIRGDANKKVKKALNYLDGHQEEEVIALLSDADSGRTNWKQKGFIPRYRNLTKMIVEKSSQLYIDNLPQFELWSGDTLQEAETEKLYNELNKISFQEIMNNVDQTLRLLKTVVLLYQYDAEMGELVIDILHRGNCEVIVSGSKKIVGLIYTTSDDTHRIFTETVITDIITDKSGKISIVDQQPNPYGIVPAATFYDTQLPRMGTWMQPNYDLVNLNESYNLHLTDADYSMKWAKLPTLFMTDVEVDGVGTERIQQVLETGSKLPTMKPMGPDVSGGPGSIVHLQTNGMGGGKAEYLAPSADISGMDKVYEGWAKAVAADWSVRIKVDGAGGATSGFQLVVEELPNLELRKQRQRMYEGAFKRSWNVLRTVLNVSSPETFNSETDLFVVFADPILPVDASQQEAVWTTRINEGRATVIDYFMIEMGLTEAEAMDKWMDIVKFKMMAQQVNAVLNVGTPREEDNNSEDDNSEDDNREQPDSDDINKEE